MKDLSGEVKDKDYLDRFKEVADGLGLDKNIANKIANFIHYEITTAKKELQKNLSKHYVKREDLPDEKYEQQGYTYQVGLARGWNNCLLMVKLRNK